jgi:hypothetical protein
MIVREKSCAGSEKTKGGAVVKFGRVRFQVKKTFISCYRKSDFINDCGSQTVGIYCIISLEFAIS